MCFPCLAACEAIGNSNLLKHSSIAPLNSSSLQFLPILTNPTTLLFQGGGLYIGAATSVTLSNATIADNSKPDLSLGSGAPLVYALPTPLGAYLEGTGTCKEAYCPDPNNPGQTKPCSPAQQLCPSKYNNKVIADLGYQQDEHDIVGPFPPKCPPGFYGNTTDGQVTSVCSGFCPAGHTCPQAGTTSPNLTTPGFYAPPGSKTPLACGGPSVICPGEAESSPTPVGDGNESFTDPTLAAKYGLLVNDSSTRTSQEPCRGGSYCVGGVPRDCTLGHYCPGGVSSPIACPAGTVGSHGNLNSSAC